MPWTPIAVRAWRTSSSLKGLMIATTSFMVGPWVPRSRAACFEGRLQAAVWAVARQMAQNERSVKRKRQGVTDITERNAASPDRSKTLSASSSQGPTMSNRSWYYAAQGQQQGPISEDELRDLIARSVVTAD